jgi:histidinol phosphatase-like PHP family hydrolase
MNTCMGASRRWLLHRAHGLRGDRHVRTAFSGGHSTVRECCEAAHALGLQLVAITERVQRDNEGDFARFANEVDAARRAFPDLVILCGCEATVRNSDGELDVSDEVLDYSDIVLGALHDLDVVDTDHYVRAVLNMLANPHVDVWAHPTLAASRRGIVLESGDLERIVAHCREQGVLVELNARHQLPSVDFVAAAREAGLRCVWGSDARHAREIGNRWAGSELMVRTASLTEGELQW